MALLIFWWMLLIWLAVIAGYLGLRYWLLSRQKNMHAETDTPVAHTSRLTSLPQFVTAFRQYKLLLRWTAGLLTVGLLAAIIVTARPSLISVINPIQKNRDIMLCLDASGSVLRVDTALINRFSALVNNFNGQRFGLTLFNSSAVSIIPLNDNYQLINQQLQTAGEAFQSQKGDVFTNLTNGTLAGFGSGTSLASDGLTSCIQHLGNNSQQRSQSIILATDNETNGTPIIGMLQAIEIAKRRNIHVFVIDPGVSDPKLAGHHNQLKLVGDQTGGGYYKLNDDSTVDAIADAIAQQAPENFIGLSQPAIKDNPQLFLYAAVILSTTSIVLLRKLEL